MKKISLVLLLLLVFVLAACGGGEDTADPTEAAPEVEPTVAETVEEAPTAEPATVAAPTEEPAAEETPTEEQTTDSESVVEGREHTADPQLVDITWEWIQRDPNGNDIDAIAVPNPENYTLLFNADGTFSAQIDCNNVLGEYATTPPGSIFMQLGPSTMVACEETSLAPQMSQMFGPAQSYSFEEEGAVLVLAWAAGGPVDYYRDASVEAPGAAEVEGIPEDAIQMDLQGLATTYSWTVQPGNPIPPGPGGQGFPPHILLTFDDATPEEVMANRGARMYIFPTQAYVDMYNAADNSIVADQVTRLEALIATAADRTELPESPMPLLPPPSTFMDRWVQFLDLNFDVGEGVRYISDASNRQQIGPWTNETTDYYYQGLTSDGLFYVSLFWPVATESLPNTYDDVPQDALDASQNPDTKDAYQQETKDSLNALPTTAWVPDLARLDAMMASLTFPTTADAGEEGDEEVDLPEPEEGEATGTVIAPDGIFIRTGPGTDYAPIGTAPFEETGTIVGVSEDGQWWVVEMPVTATNPDGIGWVSAQFFEATGTAGLPVVPTPEVEPALVGTTWEWVSTTDPQGVTAVNDPTRYTILFNADGTANIKADCNNVGATYTADDSSISIAPGPSTLVACPEDTLDQQFLAGLTNAAIYFFQEGDLFMDMQADGGTMRFRVATGGTTPPTEPPAETDAQFVVVSFGLVGAEQPVLEGTQITATFEGAEVFGNAGCNDYAGTLTPVDDFFTVGPLITTQKACSEPAGITEQEQAYLAALEGTSGYTWEEQLVDNITVVTAGKLAYVLADGTVGVINYISP